MTDAPIAPVSPSLKQLLAKLEEMFQVDREDLDFGIYRIMNMRRDEVRHYLGRELPRQVQEALRDCGVTGPDPELQKEYDNLVGIIRRRGRDPESDSNVQDLRRLLEAQPDIGVIEDEIYSHLYTFFRRYYDEGDFIAQRRDREGVYAIPYQGEEVKLHWANFDQYYMKSSESFTNYAFTTADGRRVRFRVVTAETDKDNNKAQQQRRYYLVNGENAVTEEEGELIVRFAYRGEAGATDADDATMTEEADALEASADDESDDSGAEDDSGVERDEGGESGGKRRTARKQEIINAETAAAILAHPAATSWRDALGAPAPADTKPSRRLIDKHLTLFADKNSFDYFIHKDLKGFLRRELDHFIKTDLLELDDLEKADDLRLQATLRKTRALRRIAHKIIDFLAQLEEFQKSLWLKKKFVLETQWCVTLDRLFKKRNELTEDQDKASITRLLEEIATCDKQREEWKRLFYIHEICGDLAGEVAYSEPLTVEFLEANQNLVLDTANFDKQSNFKERILEVLENIDDETDGLLINSDNFHALKLLEARFLNKLTCVYIDPPYNTGKDDFIYKDNYRSSSWAAMIYPRLQLARRLICKYWRK
jgi:adenine-specific DNA-methyltransferase